MLITLSGCATDSPVRIEPVKPVADTFCAMYVPVYTARADTEETKAQVDKNNAVWLQHCSNEKI